jgi:hypothetical protein
MAARSTPSVGFNQHLVAMMSSFFCTSSTHRFRHVPMVLPHCVTAWLILCKPVPLLPATSQLAGCNRPGVLFDQVAGQ